MTQRASLNCFPVYQAGNCGPAGSCPPGRSLVPCPESQPVLIDPYSLKQLVQEIAQGPPIMAQPTPRHAPPYGAKPWKRYVVFVIAPNTATADANATSGASALAVAEGLARFATITVLTPATTTTPVPLFSETLPDLLALRLASFGARVHSSQRAIRLNVTKNGMPLIESSSTTDNGTLELADYGDLDDPLPFYGDVQPLETLQVGAVNLDPNSGYLVEVLLQGWTYPTKLSGPGTSPGTEVNRQLSPGGFVR